MEKDPEQNSPAEIGMQPLDPLEKEILKLHFGFDKKDGLPRRLEEVGELLNMSREEVRIAELNALRKLREL